MKFIQNIGEYFTNNYFDNDFQKEVFRKAGTSKEHIEALNRHIIALREVYFNFKNTYLQQRRTKDKVLETHQFHTKLLNALGYQGNKTDYADGFIPLNPNEVIPVRQKLYRGGKPHLYLLEMKAMIQEGEQESDGIFEQTYRKSEWESVFEFIEEGYSIKPSAINQAISELFLLDESERPHYVLLLAAPNLYLIQYEKWFKGSYLIFNLEELFAEGVVRTFRNYNALFHQLCGKEQLAPNAELLLLEQLDEDSHKSAYAVTEDLKNGVVNAIELLANEAVWYMQQQGKNLYELSQGFANEIKDDCLTYVYRLLFLFFAESRRELGILPADEEVYLHGYSLEMLRDLEQVVLNSESARNGYFFSDSLQRLFQLLSSGHHPNQPTNTLNKSFQVTPIDSPLFDDDKLHHLKGIRFRNHILQQIIQELSLSQKKKKQKRGRISYAKLGINQLGSVYESLLSYAGFFADQEYIEVKNEKDKTGKDGTFVVPRSRRDDFKESEILKKSEGSEDDHRLPKGSFIYRLNSRDRRKTASYYTPEILTQTTVKYTLKHILERVEKGEMNADELLNLKMLEPAMGAAAFHNEMLNQIAEAYLDFKQRELVKKDYESKRIEKHDFKTKNRQRIAPDDYQTELQKVKAYLAINNVYGVDLNPTAVELGKLSLWLNVIYKDMTTPFFGYKLAAGNAVLGCWRKIYTKQDCIVELVGKKKIAKKWWEKAPKRLQWKPYRRRKKEQIYHFLLPDNGMASANSNKLLKAAYPDEAKRMTEWRKEFCQPIRSDEWAKL
ncbi:MAG: hypothetical protein ACPGVB_14190, partial [Chitinophagales bacterium]